MSTSQMTSCSSLEGNAHLKELFLTLFYRQRVAPRQLPHLPALCHLQLELAFDDSVQLVELSALSALASQGVSLELWIDVHRQSSSESGTSCGRLSLGWAHCCTCTSLSLSLMPLRIWRTSCWQQSAAGSSS